MRNTTNYKEFKRICKELGEDPRHLSITDLVNYAESASGEERLRLNAILAALKTPYTCPHCGRKLYLSDVAGCDFVCPNCDENFFAFEVNLIPFAA